MNDRLLCTLENSDLTGGAIGYIAQGAEASFGFIGGTGAVGGYGAADQYKTVSDKVGFIPAYEATEAPATVTLSEGERTVPMSADAAALSYRILAAESGTYDLALLCHRSAHDAASIEIYVDGQAIDTCALSFPDSTAQTSAATAEAANAENFGMERR